MGMPSPKRTSRPIWFWTCANVLLLIATATGAEFFSIDSAFETGNISIESINENGCYVAPDQRDTQAGQRWFYWSFRLRSSPREAVPIVFSGQDVISVRGPAVSHDSGWTWHWLGRDAVTGNSGPGTKEFRFDAFVPLGHEEVRYAFCPAYAQKHLDSWRKRHKGSRHVQLYSLCTTDEGRSVEVVQAGCLDPKAARGIVLLTARHHCCEAMASYVLEGILDSVLLKSRSGAEWCSNWQVVAVPFMDKDGVENGDQGKFRRPHDHNRDYSDRPIYEEVAAFQSLTKAFSSNVVAMLDLHCPTIRGKWNDRVYLVGSEDDRRWQQQLEFARTLERVRKGPIPFKADDCLPFGRDWNTDANYQAGKSSIQWARERFPQSHLVTTIEIPYADALGAEVNAETARLLGRDMAEALVVSLRGEYSRTRKR